MTERLGSPHSAFAKIPGRVLVFRFSKEGVARTFDGVTLGEAYRKASAYMGKPDHFKFQYYTVPLPSHQDHNLWHADIRKQERRGKVA